MSSGISSLERMLLSWRDIISDTLEYSMFGLFTTPDCSLGMKEPVTSRAMNCFCTLSSVFRAPSTSDLVEGSRSGTSMLKLTEGAARRSEICMPQFTGRRVETEVVSASSLLSEVRSV